MAKNIVLPHNVEDLTKCPPFGRLKAVRYAGRNLHGDHAWHCVCKCGGAPPGPIPGYKLRSGHTQSCGCRKRDLTVARFLKHGKERTPQYKVWQTMKSRCANPNSSQYHRYGARGIRVCERWAGPNGFINFLADMGECPPGHTIERKANNGHYCPENCVWATPREQARNRRSNRLLRYRGVTLCVAEWAEKTGLKADLIHQRLSRGWGVERILTTPVGSPTG